MERKMRRFRQLLPEEDARRILRDGSNGVLSLTGPDGEPYGVPVSYAYDGDGRIYFHSATAGQKIDFIGANPRCSFCVVGLDRIVPEEFTSYFSSVIVKGRINRVTDPEEILEGLRLLCGKYSPGIDPEAEISKCLSHVAVLRLDIGSMTGKEAIELVRVRKLTQ